MGRIGITYNYWAPNWMDSLEEYLSRIPRAAAIGFDLMSFSQEIPLMYSRDQQQQLLDTAEKHGIKLNYMAGLLPNQDLNSDSEEDRRRGIEHLQNLATRASEMQEGADLCGALTGVMRQGLGKRDKQVCWDHCVEGMREAIKVAEDHGVTFHIEVLNRFEHFLINTCDEALRFIEEVGSPNLKMLLDTYHMNIEEDSLGEAIVRAGDHLGLFHIGENNRRPPGRGHIPWDEVVSALKEIDYDGDTVMEPIVHPGGDVGPVLAVWRDMTDGRDLDEAAREGLEFYRQKLAEA
jgi:D-psicose/D-tagatose/L-ribulose 3-epimerase